jgi:hypothetical protein
VFQSPGEVKLSGRWRDDLFAEIDGVFRGRGTSFLSESD